MRGALDDLPVQSDSVGSRERDAPGVVYERLVYNTFQTLWNEYDNKSKTHTLAQGYFASVRFYFGGRPLATGRMRVTNTILCLLLMTLLLSSWLDSSDMQTFDSAKVGSILPMPPKDVPESLQGILWMDQSGYYSSSDILIGAPDLAFSLAVPFDAKRALFTVDVSGPTWQWMSTTEGKLVFRVLKTIGFRYEIQFNKNYTHGQIYPTLLWGRIYMPKAIISFTMETMTPPASLCPPTKGATKAEASKCATWDRVSSGLLSAFIGKYGVLHYYVFQIIDGAGQPVQPYYDAFQEWAQIKSKGVSFVGTKVVESSKAEL